MASRYRAVTSPSPTPSPAPHDREDGAFGHHQPDNPDPPKSNGPKHRDLTAPLVDRDRQDGSHQQHTHNQADRGQNQRELLEVRQAGSKPDHHGRDAVDLDGRIGRGDPRRGGLDVGAVLDLDHDHRGHVTIGKPAELLHDPKVDPDRTLAPGVVEPPDQAPDYQPALNGRLRRLRIETAQDGDGIAELPPDRGDDGRAHQDAGGIQGPEIRTPFQLIEALPRRIDTVPDQGDQAVTRRGVNRAGHHRAGGFDVGIGGQAGEDRGDVGDGGFGVEGQGALRRQPNLKSPAQEHLAERPLHPAREHHHVEQERGGHRDA